MISVAVYQAFLLFAGVVSYEDWRRRKIRNRRVLQGLTACAVMIAYLLLNSALGHHRVRALGLGEYYYPWAYYPKIAAHFALSLAAALSFWRFDIWPAGDAKFFTVTALFLVLVEPNLPGFPFLSFLVLLINIFVPAGLAFAAETLVRAAVSAPAALKGGLGWRLKAHADRCAMRARDAWPHRWGYLTLWTNLLLLFIALRFAQAELMRLPLGPLGQLAVFLGMMLVWPQLSALLCRKTAGLAALGLGGAGLCAVWLLSGGDVRAAARAGARMTLNFGLFVMLARLALNWWLERESRRETGFSALQAGDILCDDSWELLRRQRPLENRSRDGLSEEEAAALRGLPNTTTVYRTIPFAVWIFLGGLITLSCRTTVIPPLLARAGALGSYLFGGDGDAR